MLHNCNYFHCRALNIIIEFPFRNDTLLYDFVKFSVKHLEQFQFIFVRKFVEDKHCAVELYLTCSCREQLRFGGVISSSTTSVCRRGKSIVVTPHRQKCCFMAAQSPDRTSAFRLLRAAIHLCRLRQSFRLRKFNLHLY